MYEFIGIYTHISIFACTHILIDVYIYVIYVYTYIHLIYIYIHSNLHMHMYIQKKNLCRYTYIHRTYI